MDLNKPLKKLREAFRRDRGIAIRSLPTASSTDSAKASSSNPPDPRVPPSNRPVHDAQVAPTVPPPTPPTTDSHPEADHGHEECQSMTEPTESQNPELSISQRLWNAAYENLGKNDNTAKLVTSYVKILTTVLKAERVSDTSASEINDISAELGDPVKRQTYMRDLVKEGQKHIATTSKIAEGVDNVIEYIDKAKDMISVAIGNVPQAALPWAGVCLGLQILSNPGKATKSNLGGLAHVISRMDWYCALTEHLLDNNRIIIGNKSFKEVLEKLEETVITLYEALLQYQIKSVCYYRSRSLAVLRGLANWDDWDGDLKRVTDAETTVESMSVQYHREYEKSSLRQLVASGKRMETLLDGIHKDLRDFMAQQKDARIDDQDTECLRGLFVMDPQHDMDLIQNEQKEKLFDDAHKWILDTNEYAAFTSWSIDEPVQPPSRLLWIKGPAGTGKTMLLIGIIRQFSGQYAVLSPNISHFFCQGTTDKAHKNATDILKSLVWMLLIQQPHLISHLRTEHRQKGSPLFSDARAFVAISRVFERILSDPRLSATYFIVDALDECDQGLADLLKLISTSFELTDKVKWLVSSRPEVNVLARLEDLDAKNLDTVGNLMELEAQSLKGPVNIYIDYKLSILKKKVGYNETTLAEVSNLVRQQANNTFLWVALVFKELDSVEGWDAVGIVEQIPSGLSELYNHMMTRIEHGNEQNQQRCKNVLVATFLAYRPLSLTELTVLAGLSLEMTQTIIDKCGSFLTIMGETVSLIHKSAKDYLDAIYTSKLQKGGFVQGHADISRRSIDAISKLQKNIYALHPGSELEDMKVPNPDPLEGLQYCCVYWTQHLQKSDPKLDDYDRVCLFLQKHLLHWLEALGWMRKTSEGILAIILLEAQIPAKENPDLYAFVHDAKRFALYNRSVIEQAPIQLYSSALVFAPEKSIVRRQFEECIPPWVQRKPRVQANWNATLQTLEGHSSTVNSVAFSLDGKQVVSGSDDTTVRLWDAVTGAALQTLEGHLSEVNSVAFSPDGKHVVSGSDDTIVRLWDAVTGAALQTFEGHSSAVYSVAFSPDGKQVVSGSDDNTVRLWDAVTGAALQTLKGHSSTVNSVAFSPDGKQVVSGSDDNTVRLWDAVTGAALQMLEGHLSGVNSVAFSLDGKQVISGSDDTIMRLWDAVTGAALQTFEGHSSAVYSVAFSPDGKQVVSGSDDNTVRLWNAITGAALQTLEGYSGEVYSVAFSPDGNQVVSGSFDETVRLWDAVTRATLQTLEGHSSEVNSVAFSRNGNQVVSGSDDTTVRLWDAVTGAALQALKGHSSTVNSVAFSPDGKQVVSGSGDNTVRLWDAVTGAALQMLEGHLSGVNCVAFSPDGKQVVSGSSDNTARLWDADTGAMLQTLEGYSKGVMSVAFSPDGKQVVSGSYDETIRFWDAVTGVALQTLEDCSNGVTSVAFSPDGKQVVSGSYNEIVRLWDAVTGATLQTLEGHSSDVNSVAFSPDGRLEQALFVLDNWIVDRKGKILWLPPDYRATSIAIWNRTIVLGHSSGRISYFGFQEFL